MKMLNGNVLVRRVEAESTYGNSMLVIPDNAKEKPQQGVVVSAPGAEWDVVEGEAILFGKYAGTEVELLGESLLIMHSDEILCVLN